MKKLHYNPYGYPYQHPYYGNMPMPGYAGANHYGPYPNWAMPVTQMNPPYELSGNKRRGLRDYGPNPFVINIHEAAKQNNAYRTALWTGNHLQATLMSLNPGEDIGLEMHPNVDQFLRIEQGQGITQMGKTRDNLSFKRHVQDDFAIFIPAGTWHNLTNTGNLPLKLYSIYAPPNHPFGTVHPTKAVAMAEEKGGNHSNETPVIDGKTPDNG